MLVQHRVLSCNKPSVNIMRCATLDGASVTLCSRGMGLQVIREAKVAASVVLIIIAVGHQYGRFLFDAHQQRGRLLLLHFP